MRATNPLIDQIKSRLPILEAAHKYAGITPERRGAYYWCKCLSQPERTPSMRIKPDKDQYRCYSCNRYGDTIDLVAEAMGMTNREAIEYLAKDLGLDGVLSQEEKDRIELEQHRRQQERQEKQDQQNSIKAEYMRLIDIEKLMCFFISTIKEESDLERFEIIQSLRNKDLLEHWIDLLLYGADEEKLMVVETSREWTPWKET